MKIPVVSVLIPAYNAEATLKDCLDSLLAQTYQNFEIILINDGSQDETLDVVKAYCDSRLKIYSNDGNKGLIYTLNRGLALCSGKYIARMDADDIMKPARLERQVYFMENHKDVIVCGTQISYFGVRGNNYKKGTVANIRGLFL